MQFKFKDAVNYHKKGNLKKAKDICEEILKDDPNNFDNLHLIGVIAFQNKNYKNSADFLNQAININPKNAEAHNNLGIAYKKLNQLDNALKSYDEAIKIKPDYFEAYNNKANVCINLKLFEVALECWNKVIQIIPDYAEAYNNIGNLLTRLNKFDEALKNYDRAIEIKPNFAEAYNNRGIVLKDLKKISSAFDNYSKAYEIKPNLDFLLGSLIYTKINLCNWKSFDQDLVKLKDKILRMCKVTTPFTTLLLYDSPKLQKLSAEIFVKEKYSLNNNYNFIKKNNDKRKIRIGYYSADFCNHPISYLIANLFELHDRSKFELFGFYFGLKKNDEMYNRVSKEFNQFINVNLKDDKEVAQISRNLKIDIAIDLMAFTSNNRFGIFVERCAPIQINYLGYPGTTGSNCIDYIIADKILIPKESQKYYSEKIVYLPGTYQANDSTKKISDKIFTKEALGLPKDSFVFCCFNKNHKITPSVFEIWIKILKKIDRSVIWLLEESNEFANNLRHEAKNRGINPKRLIFAKKFILANHLARHKVADLFLDTFPYGAHTTCSDALWTGLPVLTKIGKSFASRVSASLLNAIGLSELITNSDKEYEDLAIELASNPIKLKEIKKKLDDNKYSKPLFNTKIFTKNIENAYSIIYDRHLKKLPFENIEI